MAISDVNEALYNLYYNVNEKVYKYITNKNSELKDSQATYPLFLKVTDRFIQSKNKIIIYGQETYGWKDCSNNQLVYNMTENKIDGIIERYQKFFHGKEYNSIHSPFWNVFRLFEDLCCEGNKEFGLLWNNIIKLGLNGQGFPHNWYDDVIKPYFNELIINELDIIKPDFIVFFTGKKRDFVLNDIFNNPERKNIDGFTQEEISEISIPKVKRAFRTHHPETLYTTSQDGSYKEIIYKIHHCIYNEME